MATYISTGKIHFGKTLLGIAFGVVAGLFLGIGYAWTMDLIPFIIVDVIIFALVIGLLVATAMGIVRIGVIRNAGVKFFAVLITCLVAWYAQWAFSTQHNFWANLLRFDRVFDDIIDWCNNREISVSRSFSSSGAGISGIGLYILYSIEFLIFLSPTVIAFKFQNDYFCEPCGTFNDNAEFYVRELDEHKIHSAEQSGDFRFIAALPSTKGVPELLGPAWQVEFSSCPNCRQNGVINIYRGVVEMDAKDKKLMFNNEKAVVKHTLVNNMAVDELRNLNVTRKEMEG